MYKNYNKNETNRLYLHVTEKCGFVNIRGYQF